MKVYLVEALVLACLFATAWADQIRNWNTLYSLEDGKIYIHLKTNDVVVLNFTLTGETQSSQYAYTEDEVSLSENQKVLAIASPPDNTTLFLAGTRLYGLTTGEDESEKDVCGNGVIGLVQYDSEKMKWNDMSNSLDLDDLEDRSSYQYSSVLSSPSNNHTIYIYGGLCGRTGKSTSRLMSLDVNTMKFSNITTATKPQGFYGASSLFAPDPNTQLVIGGQSDGGWLNMYQVETWSFDSGWSFEQVSRSSGDTIDSRIFSLALPIFPKLREESWAYITDNFKVDRVLLIGGEASNSDASPTFAELDLDSNNWVWSKKDSGSLKADDIIGAATIFDTLVIVNSSDSKTKRDRNSGDYSINMYDVSNFNSINEFSSKSSKGSSASSVKTKAILGTLIPVSALTMAVVAGIFIAKRRKLKNEEDAKSVDYQFGHMYDQESATDEKHRHFGQHGMDSNSTIDAASLNSWVKKRQEFDDNNKPRGNQRTSNETLSWQEPSVSAPPSPVIPSGRLDRSLSKLKQSFTFAPIPLQREASGDHRVSRMESTHSSSPQKRRTLFLDQDDLSTHSQDPDLATLHNPFEEAELVSSSQPRASETNEDNSDSESLVDYGVDAQVLVSSKRRSVLRVTNPDLQTLEEEDEDSSPLHSRDASGRSHSSTSSIRQRVPSGEKNQDI